MTSRHVDCDPMPSRSPDRKSAVRRQSNARAEVSMAQLVAYFLRLGALGFGGPAALVAIMEDDLVEQRKWLRRDRYLEGLAICQSLPGPLAIQVGIYVGYIYRGILGAWVAGGA